MKIKITGKELKITEAINDYVEKKLDRIDKYFEESEAEVTLRTEKTEQIAEIYVTANGEKYRAVTEDKDMYASIFSSARIGVPQAISPTSGNLSIRSFITLVISLVFKLPKREFLSTSPLSINVDT